MFRNEDEQKKWEKLQSAAPLRDLMRALRSMTAFTQADLLKDAGIHSWEWTKVSAGYNNPSLNLIGKLVEYKARIRGIPMKEAREQPESTYAKELQDIAEEALDSFVFTRTAFLARKVQRALDLHSPGSVRDIIRFAHDMDVLRGHEMMRRHSPFHGAKCGALLLVRRFTWDEFVKSHEIEQVMSDLHKWREEDPGAYLDVWDSPTEISNESISHIFHLSREAKIIGIDRCERVFCKRHRLCPVCGARNQVQWEFKDSEERATKEECPCDWAYESTVRQKAFRDAYELGVMSSFTDINGLREELRKVRLAELVDGRVEKIASENIHLQRVVPFESEDAEALRAKAFKIRKERENSYQMPSKERISALRKTLPKGHPLYQEPAENALDSAEPVDVEGEAEDLDGDLDREMVDDFFAGPKSAED